MVCYMSVTAMIELVTQLKRRVFRDKPKHKP